jgi:hypothetical protein
MVLFGGTTDGTTPLADTWTWDGKRWTHEHPATSPPGRYSSSVAVDLQSGQPVLFGGGTNAPNPLGDTWTWDGHTWAALHPLNSPPPRLGASMVSLPGGGLVLEGGELSQETWYYDTWTWDGSDWRLAAATTAALASLGRAAANDPLDGRPILFSGYWPPSDGDQMLAWDGKLWTELQVTPRPPARQQAAMALEPGSGAILFGGETTGKLFDDTWSWDGKAWRALPGPGPAGRFDFSLAYDPDHQALLLFGGEKIAVHNSVFCDTWNYRGFH